MKHLITIISSALIFFGCEQNSNNHFKNESKNLQSKIIVSDLVKPNKTKINPDTLKVQEKFADKWAFNKETIFLFLSEESDNFYKYGKLKIGTIESGKFIRIPKEDSPYMGFEKMVIKFPYFTIEQSYREGEHTNYEYITFKKEAQSIYLYKYAIDYTNIHNLEEDVLGLRLDQKTIGKVKIEDVTSEFLASLRD
ncbi:hypothetical protein NG800_002265 [Epilithonimonas ginsengisoli]|uniref:Lipoprotein n=1 Tax=Epilithonimonas ginsengisoli TaxID=1245592 RepID=A0ABU4JDH0_9FLAO|nr:MULTISPECIES: hypothetical protein [Chryseobacterium group]MBV6878691.1 hypothetical protein [Epilithonimonas sp. FP105]MDW8547717.1 hypothetical protein [Epilithonimonas ginsengisoli]OAH75941.1 hypothetical protein AXA65_02360 [Chryseobacterium sp. FP211-J200]